jgi:predicted transcriptional regulator
MRVQGLEQRQQIYEHILRFPGSRFREMQRHLKLPVGTLQYHLNNLCRDGLVIKKRDGEYVSYYVIGLFTEKEKKMLSLLRQKPIRHIAIMLLTNNELNHKRIVEELKLSPATVSWYLDKMLESRLVKKKRMGKEVIYSLVNPDEVAKAIVTYRSSFLDAIVDRFIEIWER